MHVRACVSAPPYNPGTRLIYDQTLFRAFVSHLQPKLSGPIVFLASHWIGSTDHSLVCIYRSDGSLWNCLISLTRRDGHSKMPGWPLLECVNCSSGLKGRWEHRQRSPSTTAWFIKPQPALQSVTWRKRQYVEGIDSARRSLQAKGQVTRNVWYSELKWSLLFGVQRKDTTLPLKGTFPSSL